MRFSALAMLPALAMLAGCSKEEAAGPPAALTFHEVMKDQIDVNADALWDLTNAAIGDDAAIDPAKLDDAQWAAIAERADKVRDASLLLARMDPVVVARPGVKISDEGVEGGHTAAQVQQQIDGNPAAMREMARALADHMDRMGQAARARDAGKTGELAGTLDGVCEDCHLEFWYPSQKALLEQYGISR